MVVGGFLASGGLVVFWWLCQDEKSVSLRRVLMVGLLLRAIFFPLGGGLSDDYHRYLWDGALVRDGIDPFAEVPSALAAAEHPFVESGNHRQWLTEMNSPDYHSIYPPLSQFAFAGAGLGGYWGLKILFALAELGALLLLSRIVDSRRLIFYAWNPLLILETWGQPHTEALALLGLALALWAWMKRRSALVATFGIVMAAWVKLFPLLLLPFLWRRVERRKRWHCVLVAAVVSAGLWIPFLAAETFSNLLESSHLYMLSFEFNAGPYYAIKWLTTMPLRALGWLGENQDTSKVVGPLMRGVFLCGLLWLWRMKRKEQRNFPENLSAFVFLFLITFVNLHPWYLTFAVLAMPWTSVRMCLAWLWLAACSLGTYLSYSHDLYWPFVIVGWLGFAALLLLVRPGGTSLETRPTTQRSAI
jgi:hypothetical protein